ncbi:MAG: hypothetical protein ACO3C1_12735 [Ilumatobacteraceae bacterium]
MNDATTRPDVDVEPPHLVAVLRSALVVAFAAGVVGVVTRGRVARVAGIVTVAAIVAAPLARVAMLVVHWARRRDTAFVVAGVALLVITATGALLAR